MELGAKILRDNYDIKPNARIYRKEFGFYVMEKWKEQGYIPKNMSKREEEIYLADLFKFDLDGRVWIQDLSGCDAPFMPKFEEILLEDRGKYELVQDKAGRKVLYFKGRRNGFMPEYDDHPVKDFKTWNELCKWRMDPNDKNRIKKILKSKDSILKAIDKGSIINQGVVGGYMYLRSLMGPLELLFMFYDNPKLIEDCMISWLEVCDKVIEECQKHYEIDEIILLEDICYNNGSLISPEMIKRHLFPFYQQLVTNAKRRQKKRIYIQVDTDGYALDVIDLYKSIGMDIMSPFEVASNCDVVKVGEKWPDLVISGGIDKRILAKTKEDIDIHLDYIMPTMKKRGGYIPTCDHGVPEEVSFENYIYFREKMSEYCL